MKNLMISTNFILNFFLQTMMNGSLRRSNRSTRKNDAHATSDPIKSVITDALVPQVGENY